jgi:hypothetical protein
LSLKPGPLVWRANLGLRGLTSLPISFSSASPADDAVAPERGKIKSIPKIEIQPATAEYTQASA